MKIIFVGVHNKPGMSPLSSKSRSGKLIDKIIELLPGMECVKTNLYDVEHFPTKGEKHLLRIDFLTRVDYCTHDVVVLLGAIVHRECPLMTVKQTIKIAHPSGQWSHEAQAGYVKNAVFLISKNIELNDKS